MDSPFSIKTILFLFSLFLPHSSSNTLPHQLFFPKSLPSKPSLSQSTPDTTWSISSSEMSDEFAADDSAVLRLEHIDAFSTETSPEIIFHSRLQRDVARVRHLSTRNQLSADNQRHGNSSRSHSKSFGSRIVSGMRWGSGEYFTRIGLGTPAQQYYLVLDTGSEIIWLQCACTKCYSQYDRIYNPSKSRSFRPIPCGLPFCPLSDGSTACGNDNHCEYGVSYGDGSYTIGKLISESLYFGNWRLENIAIGCGQENVGLFTGAAGILGLGRGGLALPPQSSGNVRKIFSYCLTQNSSPNSYSSIVFGAPSVTASSTVYVPLISNPSFPSFYYLGLTGLSVGGKLVPGVKPYMFRVNVNGGGAIIDSGTVVTRLTNSAYIPFRDMFRHNMKWPSPPFNFSILDTCYNFSGKQTVRVPNVGLQFGKVMLNLPGENYIIPVDDSGTNCLAFAGADDGISIIGNTVQQGFRVIYDLEESRVGFAASAC